VVAHQLDRVDSPAILPAPGSGELQSSDDAGDRTCWGRAPQGEASPTSEKTAVGERSFEESSAGSDEAADEQLAGAL